MPEGLKVVDGRYRESEERETAADWETFWVHYPRKVGKKAAARIWIRLSDAEKDAALEALPAHCRHWLGKDQQFIPHPSTWLGQARWEDELPDSQPITCKWRGCDKPGTVQNGTGKYCEKHYAALLRGETPK